jgi:N-glycosylase/DNA lyase
MTQFFKKLFRKKLIIEIIRNYQSFMTQKKMLLKGQDKQRQRAAEFDPETSKVRNNINT